MTGLAVAAAITVLTAGGAEAQVINQMCPVMTKEPVDPAMTITFRGKTIGFCCDLCIEKFKANPDKYLARLPQFASAPAADVDDGGDSASAPQPAGERVDANNEPTTDTRAPWWGRVHPALVHFPIAGMPLAFLGVFVWICRGRESFSKADVAPLLVATITAILAVNSGNVLEDATRFSESMQDLADRHEWYAERVMVLAILLSVLRIWRWNRMTGWWRWVYAGGLLLACGLLAYAGFLGGSLVFGPDHFKW